jgi:predicted dehydrogenase
VLGVARIATRKVIPAMQRGTWTTVDAIASRDEAKAREAARELGVRNAYGSYEALIADPDIDAVYIPLPNHLHVEWSTRAAEAGKHVLCEKPIGLTAADAEALVRVRERTGVLIQEAFMVRTHPQWLRAQEIARSGRIGDVRSITGYFSYFTDDPKNIRQKKEWGGGGLLDIGCYLVNTARMIYGDEPGRVCALIEDPSTRRPIVPAGSSSRTPRRAPCPIAQSSSFPSATNTRSRETSFHRLRLKGDPHPIRSRIPSRTCASSTRCFDRGPLGPGKMSQCARQSSARALAPHPARARTTA